MRNATKPSIFYRVTAGLVMGSLTLILIGLTATVVRPGSAGIGHPLVQLIVPVAAIATVLVVVLSATARAAWGRLCLTNGIVSIALAVACHQGFGQPIWPTDPVYEHALDQAIQSWFGHLMWTAAAFSSAAIVVALVFFALSYWLLHRPHGRQRAAH